MGLSRRECMGRRLGEEYGREGRRGVGVLKRGCMGRKGGRKGVWYLEGCFMSGVYIYIISLVLQGVLYYIVSLCEAKTQAQLTL